MEEENWFKKYIDKYNELEETKLKDIATSLNYIGSQINSINSKLEKGDKK